MTPSCAEGLAEPNLGESELELAFPGFFLSHLLHVRTTEPLDLTFEVFSAVRFLGGIIETSHLTRRGGDVEHRLEITGLKAHQARRLASHLAAITGAKGVSVEHQLLRNSR
jgi:hypothetical protein